MLLKPLLVNPTYNLLDSSISLILSTTAVNKLILLYQYGMKASCNIIYGQ